METHIFKGKKFASLKENKLKEKTNDLKEKGIIPKLISIQIGENKGSSLYLSLKQKAAERIGAILEIKKFSEEDKVEEVINFIKELNKDKKIHGIMVQLPISKKLSERQDEIINTISPEKDIDGMSVGGPFLTPTVKAVMLAMEDASKTLNLSGDEKVVVLGSKGFVGSRIIKALKKSNYSVEGMDIESKDKGKIREADIVVSAIGQPGFIRRDMVKEGVIVIDVGAPKGDVDFEEVSKKASYITPVPGGIGPVTIACLMENLIEATSTD
ncbi:MAG: bifunctional 5,10-methylenetetrahydrofolate dehydrogenase/5,10-methenyltetrahydrofolate cyclohydrolase [Patescibacteria group bacterium]